MRNGLLTKDRILQEALDIFARHGFEGSRMEQIAAAVGINKASLYFHFNSKEDIFRELFYKIINNYRSKTKQLINQSVNLPLKDRLIRIYTDYLDYNWNNVEMDFWNRIYYFPPDMMKDIIFRETMEAENEFIHNLEVIFDKGVLCKDIKSLPTADMAKTYYYIMTCIGLSVNILKDKGLSDMNKSFELFWLGIKGD